jgi:hypothetical protein
MRADDGRVEHLHEMRPLAQGGERFEESSNTPVRLKR